MREKQEKELEAQFLAMEKHLEKKLEKKYNKDIKYLKDEITARDFKIKALETKVESQATRILGLEAEVCTLNQAQHDDQEAYRVLTARIQPLFLHVLLNNAHDKIAHLLGHSWWDDISSNRPPSQLPTWLAQQTALVETDYMLTNNSLALLCQFNLIWAEGNNAAHTAMTEEIQEAILSNQQEGMRVTLKNLFEFTYAEELPLTTST